MGLIGRIGLVRSFKIAVWGGSVIKDAAIELVKNPIQTAAGAGDLRRLLNVIDKAPGIDEQKADAAFLDKSVALMQMDRLTFCITYDDANGTDIGIIRMDPVSEESAVTTCGRDKFKTSVISKGAGLRKPDIGLLINTENFSAHRDEITADGVVQALLFPVSNVPVIGDFLVAMVRWPTRKIAGFIISTIDDQAAKLGILPPKKDPPSSPPYAGPQ